MSEQTENKNGSDWGSNKVFLLVVLITGILCLVAMFSDALAPEKPSDCLNKCLVRVPETCEEQADCFIQAQTNCVDLCGAKELENE